MTKRGKLALRIGTITCVLSLFCLIAAVVWLDPMHNSLFPCEYYTRFHIRCATCGATRAVYLFFTGDIAGAFHYHAYFVLLSPVIAYMLFALAVDGIACKLVMPLPKKRWWLYLILAAAGLIAFTAIRNFIPETVLY